MKIQNHERKGLKVKGENPLPFSRTSNVGDSSILKLETRDFGCGPHLHLGLPLGSQTGHLYIKKFCPSLPVTFLPKQARANFF